MLRSLFVMVMILASLTVSKGLAEDQFKPGSTFRHCPACPEMVVLPGGRFMMGSTDGRYDEKPVHRVTIAKPFAVGKYEVMWDEWEACVAEATCDNGPVTKAGGDNGLGKGRRPVIEVSFHDAEKYVAWLNSKVPGKPYRLLSEAEWEYAARADIIDPAISEHSGRIVKHTGDGFLAEFSVVQDAVKCAVAMQEGLAASRLDFRMGINLGDIIDDGEDIHGEGVNIAARIEALADPGGICISRSVFDQVRNRLDYRFEDLGKHAVKHVSAPVRVYRVGGLHKKTEATPEASPGVALPDKPSIAVLPFDNISGDPEQEYFSDGITEDIITALSKLRWFLVIARNSTFVYRGKSVDIKQVVRELGVRYVLEGSVRKSGNRVRITAQLIDAESETHLWAENYDRDLTDIFELQDEITQRVTATIEPKLVAAEGRRSESRSADDLGAWHLVMRALTHYGRMTKMESQAAIEILRQAVDQYPDYGPAHSLLAFMVLVSGHVGWLPASHDYQYADELTNQATELAHRAAELDNEDPWAHLALGYLAFTERRTEDTVREYMRAIELNPNFATAYGYLGWALVFDGQSDTALEYFQQALRMSPHDPLIAFFYSGTGTAHYLARRYEEAIEWSGKAIAERPGFTAAHRIHCASLAQAGKTEETRIAVAKLKELQPNVSIAWMEQHVPYTSRAMPHFLDGMRKAGIE